MLAAGAARARKAGGGERQRGGGRRGTKNRRMRAGRGLSRLTEAAAPRPGLWPDDEERAPEGDGALWLDERAAALCGPRAEDRVRCAGGDARSNAAAGGERQNRIGEL